MSPQFFPSAAQVVGMHTPQMFGVPPPPQLAGGTHVPQSNVPPHPLDMLPQSFPCATHVVKSQCPHAFGVLNPHVSGAVQSPH
jgi:hypothetical protein